MIVGYARTSTTDQKAGLEAQERDLRAAGAEEIYPEQISSVAKREALEQTIKYVRKGDVLVVTKLDRLARSVADLGNIVKALEAKCVTLRILSMGDMGDTSTPTGKLMLNLLGSIAQFEREIMLERQREGIARAKAEKKYTGRKPTARAKKAEILEMAAKDMTRGRIAKELGIGIASVYRVLKTDRAAEQCPPL